MPNASDLRHIKTHNMKSLLLLPLALSLFSCGGNSSGGSGASNASAGGDSTFEGKGSLAYTVDGRHADIKDYLKTGGKNWIALVLNDVKDDPATGMVTVKLTNYLSKEVLELVAADKGSTSVLHFSPGKNYTKQQAT